MEDDIECAKRELTKDWWSGPHGNNRNRNCPYSAVCAHNYDHLIKVRLECGRNVDGTKAEGQ